MFTYANEAKFSAALCKQLLKKGYFVQRIESGLTGRGIPDVYTITPKGVPVWMELKRVHKDYDKTGDNYIPWRPGQLAWLHKVSVKKQVAYTVCCFNNIIVVIDHKRAIIGNYINDSNVVEKYYHIGDIG